MKKLALLTIFLFFTIYGFSQKISHTQIAKYVEQFKSDIRGPYKDIRWFCTDGSIRMPKDPCPDKIGPGVQHARYKDEVITLGKQNQVYLGQILTYTEKEEFWNAENQHTRLKQYQIDKYLRTVDNGWINQKGQFYRGALQAEDEEAWGIAFYKWLLASDQNVENYYFLIRQSLKDIPHQGDDNLSQLIRSQSKVISDEFTPFMDLRIKIHSQPEKTDIESVERFKQKYNNQLSEKQKANLNALVGAMKKFYAPTDISSLFKIAPSIKNTAFGDKVSAYINSHSATNNTMDLIIDTSELLFQSRQAVLEEKRPMARLQLLELSLKLEEIIFKNEPLWEPESLKEMLDKICYLGMASTGAGFLELTEWQQNNIKASFEKAEDIALGDLTAIWEDARRLVEWSSSMVKATYQKEVDTYTAFEPKAYGFIDDKIRGSVVLYLGQAVAELGDFIADKSKLTNKVFNIPNQSAFRGLNPGYAFGELVVVDGSPDNIEVSSDKIYIFQRPPADLKPVAGIATVSEGNMVSHVQLLARNLGIPNAALSNDNLNALLRFNGQNVFYAVSNKGTVIMKPENEMTDEERKLFLKTERNTNKVKVPVESVRLDVTEVLDMSTVDANDSGKPCGPKAANLGQLKKMFPNLVVEGLVIPFGIFKAHMDQPMVGQNKSYWEYLNAVFAEAENMRSQNMDEKTIEEFQLKELEVLRQAIKNMPLKENFMTDLEQKFKKVLGNSIGAIPVFLRSDTNMEDLKDFTGAGLNLTLFNVAEKEKILQGIKDVWASPYTERSFKWRQKFLLNPENVFPSILVIPSVDVDYSGVLITKGISNNNESDLTVAFSRGAGGAVDGQSAETYLIKHDGGHKLLAPAREPFFNSLPVTGGTSKRTTSFETPILNDKNINDIRHLANKIRETVPQETHSDYDGAYDVELGFKDDNLWLFQIRPFVENKNALSSEYLESITPQIDVNKKIALDEKIQ